MGRLSEWWFGRFSDDWVDIGTTRAFLGALGQTVLSLLLFVLLFALAAPPEGTFNEQVSAVGLLLAVLVGAAVGGVSPYLHFTKDRFEQLGQTISYRFAALLLVYGGYWLLLTDSPVHAVWFAISFLVSKILVLTGMYLSARL